MYNQKLDLQQSELKELFDTLLPLLQEKKILLLQGDLGSGKTTFVRELLHYSNTLAQSPQNQTNTLMPLVSSPTFSLAQSYESAYFGIIHHYDFYQKTMQEMLDLGVLDMLAQEGLHCVEWGDENWYFMLQSNGFDVMRVSITQIRPESRLYRIIL